MIRGALAMTLTGNRMLLAAPVRTPSGERIEQHRRG